MNVPIVKCLCSISRASCIALALCLVMPGLLNAAPTTQVFVLHSYSQEYPWTQGQHDGFIQALAEDAQVDAAISTEYLDTKRHTYDEAYSIEMARHLQIKYKGYKPAAIYVTDDNALLFARDHLSRVFPDTPVFFSGVNDYGVQNSLNSSLFTGVFERKEVAPNLEWLLHLDKDANDLIFIGDGSNTYQAIEHQARNDLIPYRLRATFLAEKRLDRALARLHDLPGNYLFLTTLGGMIDANGQVLPLHDIIKSLVLTNRIVVSMEDAYIIEGVLGGSVTSGRKQGMNAARLFLAHMHGKPIVDLPPILKSPNALIFDDQALQQFDIPLPEDLRAQAVLLNPRPGFYERHRSLILGSLIGLAVLLFWVVTGALVILTLKNRELSLARNSAEDANALFNQLAGQSRTVHWEINAEGVFTHVSPVSYALLGYHPEELINKKHFYDLLPEEERDAHKTSAFKFFAQKEPFHDLHKTLQTKDGQLVWVLTNAVPLLDDHGLLLGYRGSDNDITERKQAGEALRESERKYRDLLERSPVGIFKTNSKGQVFYVNPEMARIVGANSPEEAVENFQDLSKDLYADPNRRNEFIALMKDRGIVENFEYEAKGLYDKRIWLSMNARAREMFSDGTFLMDGFTTDITARKQAEADKRRLEEQLQRAEKMEALGTLAGGVAHDLNNVLGVVVGFTELLMDDVDSSSPLRRGLENILGGGQKAAAIVQDLLTLARRGVSGRSVLNLNEIIVSNLNSPEVENLSSFHSGVRIRSALEPDLLNIAGSFVHLGKTFFNLVSNAAEAMPESGTVTIKTANQYLDKPIQGYDEIREGDYVVLSVSDTGDGIHTDDLNRIFEPFYTKKVMGRSGTGLGLAVVWGTVKDHHGYINVQSKAGKGSVFTLYFPVTREELTADAVPAPFSEYMGKGESILVVDDIEEQRDLASTMLKKLGYRVESVSSGENALTYIKTHPVDLIVLDMIMDPGMDGLDTYRNVLKILPKQKTIIVSGFSESERVGAAQALGAGAYVRKPYIMEKLGIAVRKELERNS
jgi:PAS domain S-box-containing protein